MVAAVVYFNLKCIFLVGMKETDNVLGGEGTEIVKTDVGRGRQEFSPLFATKSKLTQKSAYIFVFFSFYLTDFSSFCSSYLNANKCNTHFYPVTRSRPLGAVADYKENPLACLQKLISMHNQWNA